ncbi:MAG: HIT family protein [Erysipelotrichales bacterium]|nr:MAG: HIT family protein [Erysipelotrichales bacterium]
MCIFCKIISKEIPSSILYEDKDTLAILDVSQVTLGHTLILPKQHFDDFRHAPDETLAHCMSVVQRVADGLEAAFEPIGFNIISNCGEAAGQSVHHLHFHLIPRYDGNDGLTLKFRASQNPNLEEILNVYNKKNNT